MKHLTYDDRLQIQKSLTLNPFSPYREGGNLCRSHKFHRHRSYTDMTIKVRYIFIDRKKVDLEFADGDMIAAFIIADRRREASAARQHRRHNYSLDAITYEGEEYTDKHTPEKNLLESLTL